MLIHAVSSRSHRRYLAGSRCGAAGTTSNVGWRFNQSLSAASTSARRPSGLVKVPRMPTLLSHCLNSLSFLTFLLTSRASAGVYVRAGRKPTESRLGRGRDSSCLLPPAQTRAGATNAHGSYLGCWDV